MIFVIPIGGARRHNLPILLSGGMQMPVWQIAVDRIDNGGQPLLRVAGDVDIYTHELLREMLGGLVRQGHQRVSLDLEGVKLLDSAGASVLRAARDTLQRQGGQLVLEATSAPVRRELLLRGMDELVGVA